jgi:hypothetical protein
MSTESQTLVWNGINATSHKAEPRPADPDVLPYYLLIFLRARVKVRFVPKPIRRAGISLQGGAK